VTIEVDSWDVRELEPTRNWRRTHYKFAVRIEEKDFAWLEEDDVELTWLRERI
jgi:hypothetical protein